MTSSPLDVHIPIDRRLALAGVQTLPGHDGGTVLIGDIAGFSRLTGTLVARYGGRRGAERLNHFLLGLFDPLVNAVHDYRGAVVSFSGDAMTCWFAGDDGLRAASCALEMQRRVVALEPAHLLLAGERWPGDRAPAIKVGIAAGEVRRLAPGDPQIRLLDVLVGRPLLEMAAAEAAAAAGDIVISAPVALALAGNAHLDRSLDGGRFVVLRGLREEAVPSPWPEPPPLPEQIARPWLLPPVAERLRQTPDAFMGELRPVVPLFLRFGWTPEALDQAGIEHLHQYVRWVQQTAATFGGHLIELTVGEKGSYVYLAFGAPVAHDDDVRRALATARQLLVPPPGLDDGPPAQIGLARGVLFAGAYGGRARQGYGIIGQHTNLAARLMMAAPGGEIFCDEAVQQAANHHYQFRAVPSLQLKGVRHNAAYALVEPAASQHSPTATPFVGRQPELAVLSGMLERLAAGESGVLVLEGEAGIGKSRLLAEFLDRASRRPIAYLAGAGTSIEQRTPYHAWREPLRAYFDLRGDEAPVTARSRVQRLLAERAPDQLRRLPLLNDLLALDFPESEWTRHLPPELRQQSVAELVATLWLDAQAPPLLLLEDAHWLDTLSWQIVQYLARRLQQERLGRLLLLSMRPPGFASQAAGPLAALLTQQGVRHLTLNPLRPQQTAALVAGRLQVPPAEVPPALLDLLRERGEGNPFFTQELLLALQEQGVVQVEGGRCRVTSDLAQRLRDLPETLHGLVLSRIDTLSPGRQLTMKIAAVVGRNFAYPVLHDTLTTISQAEAAALPDHLRGLEQRQLVEAAGSAPAVSYLFRHAITHEAAYQTLSFDQRRQLHRLVARWYERSFGLNGQGNNDSSALPLLFPLLAHHYRHAELAEPERHYLRLAAEQAMRHGANDEAVAHLSRALELTPAGPRAAREALLQRFDLLFLRQEVLGVQSKREAQLLDLEALTRLARRLDDPLRLARVHVAHARYALLTSDYGHSRALAEQAIGRLQHVEEEEAVTLLLMAHVGLASAAIRLGHYVEAQETLERILPLAREVAGPLEIGRVLHALGNAYYFHLQYEPALDYFREGLAFYEKAGDRQKAATLICNLGAVAMSHHRYQEAVDHFQRALSRFRDTGDRFGQGMMLNHLGRAARFLGRPQEARALYEQALALRREAKDPWGESITLGHIGSLLADQGEMAEAQRLLEQALHIARDINDPGTYAEHLYNRGLLRLEMGEYAPARDDFAEALARFETQEQQALMVEGGAALAYTLLQMGEEAAARERLEQALAGLDTVPALVGAHFPFRAYLFLYRLLDSLGDPRAPELLVRACRLLQEWAQKVEDPQQREAFLQNVPEHRALWQLEG